LLAGAAFRVSRGTLMISASSSAIFSLVTLQSVANFGIELSFLLST
jgi:hypothetical protein